MFGFLNVYKPRSITSHDVINKLRKLSGIKKIGHAGTLDPSAEGVLPVAISSATRLIDFLPTEKEYIADFKLGYISDSYDMDCELHKYSDKKVSFTDITDILPVFSGTIKQKPPIYSAVKVKGKKLYEIARNGGTAEIPEREITVNKILLSDFDYEKQSGKIIINCSKGTYIRSIINDIGIMLETGAVMSGLIRTLSGGMNVINSIKLENFSSKNIMSENLISPELIIKFPVLDLTENQFIKVKNGNDIFEKFSDGYIYLKYNSKIVALAEHNSELIKVKKVFINE